MTASLILAKLRALGCCTGSNKTDTRALDIPGCVLLRMYRGKNAYGYSRSTQFSV